MIMRHMNSNLFNRSAGMLLGAFLFTGTVVPAQAALITLSGNSVDYTFDDSLLGLFGPASVAGDTLFFTPTEFKATSTAGVGLVSTTQSLDVQISLKPGFSFVSLSLLERGDYLLFGPGTNTADVSGMLSLTDSTHTLGIALGSADPLDIVGLPTHNWEIAVADLTGWVPALDLTLSNTLSASTDNARGIAFVEKKYVGITVSTVPEPGTWAIMLLGLGLLGLRYRLYPASRRAG